MKLLLFAALMCGRVEGRSNRVADDMILLGSALQVFKSQAGRYPTEEEGLMALVEKPLTYPENKRWERVVDKAPRDPWNNPYQYVILANSPSGEKNAVPWFSRVEGIALYSFGPDGISISKGNDEDDFNTWSESCWDKRSVSERLWDSPPVRYTVLVASLITGIALLRRWHSRGYRTP
jgi:general secretion pathway protein G